MNVLVVYAHPNPDSFTHAILEQVTKGLDDGPHTYKVNDLYASGFDPVFTQHDSLSFLHEGLPEELLAEANPRQVVLDSARGPLRRVEGQYLTSASGGISQRAVCRRRMMSWS